MTDTDAKYAGRTRPWSAAEIAVLRRLRAGFLESAGQRQDYWRTLEELALYDATLGERIGWKWDAVLHELALRGWQPVSQHVLDWGCGSGIAGRRALAVWPHLRRLALHDRSAMALQFAASRARAAFPEVDVTTEEASPENGLLVISHVLNELPAKSRERLLELAALAREIVWVEAGTHADSRDLIAFREHLLARGFHAVAPCTHSAACGLLSRDNQRHWCHHFAAPPAPAFQDAGWAILGKELGIDLRSLPYSFVVLTREPRLANGGWSRILGAPRDATGYSRVLSCQAEGVRELMLQKRAAPALLRTVRKGRALPVYRWEVEQEKIRGGISWEEQT